MCTIAYISTNNLIRSHPSKSLDQNEKNHYKKKNQVLLENYEATQLETIPYSFPPDQSTDNCGIADSTLASSASIADIIAQEKLKSWFTLSISGHQSLVFTIWHLRMHLTHSKNTFAIAELFLFIREAIGHNETNSTLRW